MLTKTEAVRKSILKWERIVTELREGQLVRTRGDCGFCEFARLFSNEPYSCQGCPLFPDICGNFSGKNNLFWQITNRLDARRPALQLAKRMVKEIRKRGNEWIKESKSGAK